MRLRALICAGAAAACAVAAAPRPEAMGKPGLSPVPCPTQDWRAGDPAFEPLPGAKAHFGAYDGGLYRVEIPDAWNGDLVLYAHGFVSNAGTNGSNLRVQNSPIREHLIKEGFAWAASSYRCNGYVPGQGLLDTMALVDLFTQANNGRAPQRTYLTGTSMGGHVTVLGMHEFPTSFVGGLAMCPAGPELFDYFAAVSAAAEVITGVSFSRESLQQDAAKMADVLGKPPDLTDKGRQLASVEIQISGGPRPFAMEGLASRFIPNMSTSQGALVGIETPVNRALTNTHIKYVVADGLGLSSRDLNARVRRKPADRAMRNPNGPYEEVVPFDGRIARPLLTMHGTGDLFVPVFLEQSLKRAVAAAGNDRLLVQRLYRIGGHCQFSQPEMIAAFDDLVRWVRQGARPAGDEVYGNLSDAGRRFTNPLRRNDPGSIRVTPAGTANAKGQGEDVAPRRIDFVRDVQPIFRQSCYGCHGPIVHHNGLRLDRRHDALRGGTIALIGPGNSAGSRLYLRLLGELGPQMPPTGALKPEQIETVKQWIDQGAEWPDSASGEVPARPPDRKAVRLADAIRSGDRRAFAKLASEPGVGSLRGDGGTTPLMTAALYGDVAAVRVLLDGGADVNARNDSGATALMWAVTDAAKTRTLLEYGADVNAKSEDGRTPLMIAAAGSGAAPVVRLLLEYGADPSVEALGTTPLVEAAYMGDEESLRAILASRGDPGDEVLAALAFALRQSWPAPTIDALFGAAGRRSLDMALGLSVPPDGDATALPVFFEHGLDPTMRGPKGQTLLTALASSDRAAPEVAKFLIERGVDVNARTADGASALALAAQRGRTALVDLLTAAGATPSAPPANSAVPAFAPAPSPRAAVERALPLLQQASATFTKKSGCVSCHNDTLTAMSVAAARRTGLRVNEASARGQLAVVARYIESWRERALVGIAIPGDADTTSYILLGLAAEGLPPNEATDALARFLLRQQKQDGHWFLVAHRPPIESSDIEVTAASMHALQTYAPRALRTESTGAIARAVDWIRRAPARTTEDRAFKLLGLVWGGAAAESVQAAARDLLSTQKEDGGWSQLPTMASDAYATGQALYAIAESRAVVPGTDAIGRGVRFLLDRQAADGSWRVPSRVLPIQPYFESGFPYGRDQFVSAAATNWATLALIAAIRPST